MAFISTGLNLSGAGWNDIGPAMVADTTCNIYIVNRGNTSANFNVGISATTPALDDVIFYEFPLAGKGTFIITDVLVKTGDKVWVEATTNFTVRIEGKT